ncbi:MAG: nucleotide exchange factor GrpE [Chitinophagales bacterium]|nr:nucleotide exchange factor GrpE [Chitinophagales bacterium]
MENRDQNQQREEQEDDQPDEKFSDEEILNKIDKDAAEEPEGEMTSETDGGEGNDLLSKFGLSRKDKHKKEIAEHKQKAEEANDRYLRLYAEFENYKKRNIKDRFEFSRLAGIEIINALLPVIDDFSRAMRQMEASQDINALQEGVKLIHQKLRNILESKGLKQMNSVGEIFNPELHEAISQIAVQDETLKGRVTDEIECGYYLNEKIIRHAKVVVGS